MRSALPRIVLAALGTAVVLFGVAYLEFATEWTLGLSSLVLLASIVLVGSLTASVRASRRRRASLAVLTVGTLLFVSALLHDPATCLLVETAGARTGFAYDWSTGVLHFGDRYGDGYRCHKQVSASVVGSGYAVTSLGAFAAVSEQPSRA